MKINILLLLLNTLISVFLVFYGLSYDDLYSVYGKYIYYFISLIFFMWIYYGINLFINIGINKIQNFLRIHIIALTTSIVIVSLYFFVCPPEYRVLADETNLLSTSKALYETNDAFWNAEALGLFEDKQAFNYNLDKRLIAFPYFLSIIHSLKGYSPFNVFILNALLSFGCLFLFYYLIQRLWGNIYGFIALLLLSIYPLFIQYSMSASYDIFNLFFALLSFASFCKFYEKKSILYADFLIYTVALLSYSRYECSVMAIFIMPLTVLILDKNELNKLKYEFIIYPFLFMPIAWIMSFANTKFYLQVGENENTFSINYLKDNIFKAFYYFSGYDPELDTVFIIAITALLSFFIIIIKSIYNKNTMLKNLNQYKFHILALGFFLLIESLSKFSYKYGDLNQYLQSRFGLVFLPYIVFLSVYFIKYFLNKNPKFRLQTFLIILFMFLVYWPRAYKNIAMKTVNTTKFFKSTINYLENDYKNRNKNNYIVVSHKPNFFVPFNFNSILFKTLNDNFSEIKKQIKKNKNWNEILVIQVIIYGEVFEETKINPDIELNTIFEKAINDNIYIRFSKVKLDTE